MQISINRQNTYELNLLIKRILLIASGGIYSSLLIWIYIHIISVPYSYLGFTYHPPALFMFLWAYVLAHLPLLWLPITVNRPSQVVYWFLYIVVIVPACIIPTFLYDDKLLNTLPFAFTLVFSFALLGTIYLLPCLTIANLRFHPQVLSKLFPWVLALLILVFFAHIFSVFGFNLRFVSLLDVYEIRLQYTELATGKLIGYSVNWLALVISPLLIAYGLTKKKLVPTSLGVFITLIIYGLAAYKSILFSSFLMIIVFLGTTERNVKRFGFLVIIGAAGLVFVNIVIGLLLRSPVIPFFLVGRIIAMPGVLTAFFFDFFSQHPKALLGYSIFHSLVDYPYPLVPSYLIGDVYFNNPAAQANVHLWADAFANFGYIGIIIFTGILAIIMWLFDSFAKLLGFRFIATLLSIHALTFANSALLTAILSQGVGFTLALLFVVPENEELQFHRSGTNHFDNSGTSAELSLS